MIRTFRDYLSKPERRAVGLVFMALSLMFGAWVTRLPEVKDQLALTEAELGLALFFMPLGAITLLPFYSAVITRLGERKATLLGIYVFLPAIVLTMLASSLPGLMATLYLVGLAMGLTDVAMNAVAAEVERQFDCRIMSASHGFFSLGGMIGAATAGLFFWLELGPLQHLLFWSVLLAIGVILVSKQLVSARQRETASKAFQLPPRSMWGLALIGFCIMMSEGGITDWSTIYLRDSLLAPSRTAGLGFAGFSAFMALGRFLGDDLIAKQGSKKLTVIGAVLAIAGLLITLWGSQLLAVIGFSLAGLGYSVIVPVLFSQAATTRGVDAARGIASVASAGYIGLLVGPVAIGFVAESFGLANGFLFLMGLTALALVIILPRSWH